MRTKQRNHILHYTLLQTLTQLQLSENFVYMNAVTHVKLL